ncbi:cysteine hydrolase family protein [Plasticicumulans sp.]|uniref:cysteine hydrolase family protein n=1 Tax=Plasticicumulans sp. TaxID=2307179 RepID=UPI002B7283B7|nr:isochorismatase family cysteine hydrolase [Plasticicumulans sp.]
MNAAEPFVASETALLFVDPYNDFISEGGKFWERIREVAESRDLIVHLQQIVSAARRAGVRLFYVPHRQWQPGDFEDWDHPTPYQLGAARFRMFEKGSWGGEWRSEFAPQPGDVIAKEHYASSGFANTDLDFLLKQHRIRRVIVIGLLANTCIETTARFATELGYHTTIVTDATAAVSEACMHAAHELNGPTYAHAILTTAEVVAALAG